MPCSTSHESRDNIPYNATNFRNPQVLPRTLKYDAAGKICWPPAEAIAQPPGCICKRFLCGDKIALTKRIRKYVQPKPRHAIRQTSELCMSKDPFTNETVYRRSYYGTATKPPEKIIPKGELCLAKEKMTGKTTHLMSYPPWCNLKPPCPIYPNANDLKGRGPMQSLTTHKHDYVPKCVPKPRPIYHRGNLCQGSGPMSDQTVHKFSYQPVCQKRPDAVRPVGNLCKGSGAMAKETTQRMSYQPVKMPSKVYMPWAAKEKYCPPKMKVDDKTIFRTSYEIPGVFVEECQPISDCGECACNDVQNGCQCRYPGECFGLSESQIYDVQWSGSGDC